MVITSIWLEVVEFILSKDSLLVRSSTLSVWSMRIFFQSLIYHACHPQSDDEMCLFDLIPFNETFMGWPVNVEYTTCVLFWACFEWKKIHNIPGPTGQVMGLNAILSLGTERFKCFSGHSTLGHFVPSTSTWSTTAFLLFNRCYLRSYKNVFQTLNSSEPNSQKAYKRFSTVFRIFSFENTFKALYLKLYKRFFYMFNPAGQSLQLLQASGKETLLTAYWN